MNILVGQKIKLTAAVFDFCGVGNESLFVNEVGINYYPQQDPDIACLDLSGIGVTFWLVGISSSAECNSCSPNKIYSVLGVGTTNQVGIVAINHDVTDSDLLSYTDSVAKGTTLRVIACITDSKNQAISTSNCSDQITVFQALNPTHRISLSMGFIPTQLADYFQEYIVDISQQLMTKIAYPPAPWIYVKTTYNSVDNSFNLWFYLPSTMSPDPTSSLWGWILGWAALIVGVILAIIGAAIIFTGGVGAIAAVFGTNGLLYFGVGALILAIGFYSVLSNQEILRSTITNQGQQISQVNKENQAKNVLTQAWESSSKTQSDCLNRLKAYADLHISIINGYSDVYAKYANLVTALNSEKDGFTTTVNAIITEFQAANYNVDVCNTYYSKIDAEVTASNVRISTLISQNVAPGEGYSPTCAGWANQTDCEKAECYWYNSACHKDPDCWIPNPVGGCILSASTGWTIVGVVSLITIAGVAYWLLTRHPEETRTIVRSARGAVTGEAERARQAYRRIVPATEQTQIQQPLPLPPASVTQ